MQGLFGAIDAILRTAIAQLYFMTCQKRGIFGEICKIEMATLADDIIAKLAKK